MVRFCRTGRCGLLLLGELPSIPVVFYESIANTSAVRYRPIEWFNTQLLTLQAVTSGALFFWAAVAFWHIRGGR